MTRGGARNRSGPPADPDSGRSERRAISLQALPPTYDGPVPDFPLPDVNERELEVWATAWTWPQANAWSMPSEQWRLSAVALWVRTFVRCEAPDAGAATLAQLHRFADQVGLTTAGLREMGWKIAPVAEKAAVDEPTADQPAAPVRRLRVASGGAG